MSVLFVDFEDSFSFNILQELQKLDLTVHYALWNKLPEFENFDLVILGPGPGHPDEYAEIFPVIQKHLKQDKKFFGICLGHQILAIISGFKIERCKRPVHGQSVKLSLPSDISELFNIGPEIEVQRYNSLAVIESGDFVGKIYSCEGEVQILIARSFISYQFHPESMGTKCRQAFFRPIIKNLL